MAAALLTIALFAVMLGGLVWIRARVRRRGGGEGLMGVFEEMWYPAARRTHVEIVGQEERPAPAPLPGDRLIPGLPPG